jgi:hypothetical protein
VIPAPAAVLDAITAALLASALARFEEVDPPTRRLLETIARLDAEAAWRALVGVSEVREEWVCTGEPGRGFPTYRFTWPMPGQAAEDAKQAAIDFVAWVEANHTWDVGPVLHRRLVITTPTEEQP